jgi:hypothetical protein
MTNIRRFLLGLVVFMSSMSWAADAPAKDKKVVYKKSETHKFSGLKLKGEFKKPDLSYIYQRKGIRSEQIIDIPGDFNAQIRDDSNRF